MYVAELSYLLSGNCIALLSGNCIAALHISRILNSTVLDDGITNAAERGIVLDGGITNAAERYKCRRTRLAEASGFYRY